MRRDSIDFYRATFPMTQGNGLVLHRDPSSDLPSPPKPGLPAPRPPRRGPGRGPGARPPLVTGGPYDVRRPLPYDSHEYPDAPTPPPLSTGDKVDLWLCVQLRRFVDENGRPKRKRRELPPDSDRPRLPDDRERPRLPDDRDRPALPAYYPPQWMDGQEWAEMESQLGASDIGIAGASAAPSMIAELGESIIRHKGLEELDAYLKASGIRHFSAKEITRHAWRSGHTSELAAQFFMFDYFAPETLPGGVFPVLPRYVIPPREMWPNILPALRVLDRFREWLGGPVLAFSGYRHPTYNASIDGATDSRHMSFAAVDFTWRPRTAEGLVDFKRFEKFFAQFRQRGDGLGRYAGQSYGHFMHIDVGTERPPHRENWVRPKSRRDLLR